MKTSRCDYCPATASVECMRNCPRSGETTQDRWQLVKDLLQGAPAGYTVGENTGGVAMTAAGGWSAFNDIDGAGAGDVSLEELEQLRALGYAN